MIADSAHGDEPGDDDRDTGEPGDIGVDALHGTQPEETNEEE